MKNIIWTISLLACLLPLFLNAQGWEKTYDGGHDENVWTADRTLDGGIIMAGTQTNNTTGLETLFIYKTDADGNLQWEYYKTEVENAFVQTEGILTLNDGNFLLSFASDSAIPTNSIGQKVYCPIKIGSNEMIIERGNLNAGLYFFSVKKGSNVLGTGKFVIN